MSKVDDLRKRIENVQSMLCFTYDGKDGDIEMWSRYRMTYDGALVAEAATTDELIHIPCFDGKSLLDIVDQIKLEDG